MLTHIESCCAIEHQEMHDGWHVDRFSSTLQMQGVLNTVGEAMRELGYAKSDIFGVRLAMEEAIVNSIKHGHQYDPTKRVEVRYRVSEEHVLVEVEDEGPGFIHSLVPDPTQQVNWERPSGRGLLLIRHYSTWVRFNSWGNCVTFCKCPSEPLDSRMPS